MDTEKKNLSVRVLWDKLINASRFAKIVTVIVIIGLIMGTIAMCTISDMARDIVAGDGDDDLIDEVEEPAEEPEPEVNDEKEQKEEPKYRAALTYEGRDTPLELRPIAAFVENSPDARPQSGLDKADIVYEILAEGQITRFVALYQSKEPDTIGPIRSARPYLLDIAKDYDAIIAHAGGSVDALNKIANEGLPNLSELVHGQYFTRESFRRPPHNVYTNLAELRRGAKDRDFRANYNLPELIFEEEAIENIDLDGRDANEIGITYSNIYQVKYRYDKVSEEYGRFMNNSPHSDMTTNTQIKAKNLFVVYARHRTLDGEGRLAIDLRSTGKAQVIQMGKANEAIWRYEGGLIRFYINGEEVKYLPGNSWIQVVPDVSSITIE